MGPMSAEQKACVMKATDVTAMDSCFGDSGYNPLTGSQWKDLKQGIEQHTRPAIDKLQRSIETGYGSAAK